MARRIRGSILVTPRPNGGAVVTLKAATGEAIEIERDAAQVADLASALSALVPEPPAKQQQPATSRLAKPKEKSIA